MIFPNIAQYGPYFLRDVSSVGLVIRYRDVDESRTVCRVETIEGWDQFVAGLHVGMSESQAVESIERSA